MSTRHDSLEDRLSAVEDKLTNLQEQLDLLPELIASRIAVQVCIETNIFILSITVNLNNIYKLFKFGKQLKVKLCKQVVGRNIETQKRGYKMQYQ